MSKPRLISVCALALLLLPGLSRAATVSPSVLDLEGTRGEIVEAAFTVYNASAVEQLYFLDVLAFDAAGEDGSPVFLPEEREKTALLSWIDFPVKEVRIPAQSRVDVPFRIAIPDDVESGSYHGALTVSSAPSDIVASNGALLEAKTAVLVFLAVKGETTARLALLDFAFEQNDASHPYGLFSYRVQNQGNIYLIPRGRIELRGLFGQTIESWDANPSDGRVLPGSTRTYAVEYAEVDGSWLGRAGYQLRHLAFGPATVRLQLAFADRAELEASQKLWLFPTELAGTLVVLAALFSIPFLRRKKVT